MKIINYKDVEAKKPEEGSGLTIRWLITKDMGAENFAMRFFEVAPGGFSPLHKHPWEHEVFILDGEGIVTDGKDDRRFRQGDAVFIPPNEEHQFKNTG
ncbi:cupin domain-containing protein, partial [Candidatus Bathyarchaeota archaeon]|nr:cupin domain-containing protein [Candidatus Bathyarchaeota archaeon]